MAVISQNNNMKVSNIYILLFLFKCQNLFCQEVINLWEPILLNNHTFVELEIDKRVIDEIRYDHQLVYIELILDGSKVEYHKADDSVYYFRQWLGDEMMNYGYYKKGKPSGRVDSVFTFHPETYEEKLFIVTYYELEKHGFWNEKMIDNTYWRGNYIDGERTGRWFKSTDNGTSPKYGEYKDGKLTALYNPSILDIEHHIDWLFGETFTWCRLTVHKSEKEKIETWWLETDNSYDCESFGEFQFFSNGEFEYKHNDKYNFEAKKKWGKGTWKINENGGLELQFQDKSKEIFSIKTLSHSQLQI
ncbi:MAG: hypothetical protein DWQ02_08840, partial [Bacteroidetes bacterium]